MAGLGPGQISDMATDTSSKQRRLPGAARRELIVNAALAEFAAHGYDAASMGRIGRAAGVTRAVLYDHFPSKRALFDTLLENEQAVLLDHLRAAIAADAPAKERMHNAFDALFEFAEEQPTTWRLLFPEHAPVNAGAAADHRRRRAEANRLMAGMLAPDAKRAGLDPESTIAEAVFAVQRAAIRGIVDWWYAHPNVTREELVEAAMQALWTGMRGG